MHIYMCVCVKYNKNKASRYLPLFKKRFFLIIAVVKVNKEIVCMSKLVFFVLAEV